MQGHRGLPHQLPLGNVLLPPEVGSHGRDGREPVVGVHQYVDEAVQCGPKIGCQGTQENMNDEPIA